MRVAFFSPLPPSKSGIADYAAALLDPLRNHAEVQVFADAEAPFDPSRFDVALYQIGNNPYHAFAYETALRHPGVAVMHEANLHHLIADLTIRRDDWDAYLREAEYNGGERALDYARRVRALETGPDYDGLPMLRRILERSRGVVAHSRFVAQEIRRVGFTGPVAVIPHGAWIPVGDRMGFRHRLGLDELTPLVGAFGFLKPYKRISESLRAFRRLVRLVPEAKMILVGEPHPAFPVHDMIRALGLGAHVRVIGFAPIEDFVGYIAACDIVLNLRYPTVGESSGSMLRAMGLGKAVLVSDVGAFREFPDEICLKVPVGPGEEEFIFEYLNTLVSRPEMARAMGRRAREWVERECAWDKVAERYARFLACVVEGREWKDEPEVEAPGPVAASAAAAAPAGPPPLELPNEASVEPAAPATEEYILGWVPPESPARGYAEWHLARLTRTLEITPPGTASDRVLEMGAYLQITPALGAKLGYGEVRGCYYGPRGHTDHRTATSIDGEVFECDLDLFDAEKDPFPYADEHFSTVLCCELIEHLAEDPMAMMAEINRVLHPGGHVVLTTPNLASSRAIAAILQGFHPGFFPAYVHVSGGEEIEARHNREYTPREIRQLLFDSGFEVTLVETGPFRDVPRPELGWVAHLLDRYLLDTELRGDGIYAVGRKVGAVRERYPAWLYSGGKP
jgi:glycosyltransferase involved in cell wall biosynthesis/SAM-dependent methyltransferase